MVLKTSQATPQAWEEYQRNFGRLSNHSWGVFRLNIIESSLTTFLSSLVTILILWLGSYTVIERQISIGQLIAFSGMSGNCLGFLGMMVGLVDELLTARVVVQRLGEVMDATPETDAQSRKPSVTLPQGSTITCSDVSFHHVGRVDLLKDFNLVIPGGQVTAIVGQSGCGKSTLVKLLAGLYPPQSGNIRFGPYNLRDIDLECLRQQVVLIPQEAHFWSRSILDNFRFAYPDASFEAIVEACRIALADGFISELPDQYHTVLGEFGANLSGGQKQRLAIARALLANPEVLILDESTSALDPVLEGEVLEQLLAHRRGRTTILISHRPRVVLRADYVVYLERGTVRFQGHPKELLALPGQHQEYLRP
jgi:ABC-type bacteriocin/lantibiotic exporter with double-glycine peptidase domain